jgi:hypothetical protein
LYHPGTALEKLFPGGVRSEKYVSDMCINYDWGFIDDNVTSGVTCFTVSDSTQQYLYADAVTRQFSPVCFSYDGRRIIKE